MYAFVFVLEAGSRFQSCINVLIDLYDECVMYIDNAY